MQKARYWFFAVLNFLLLAGASPAYAISVINPTHSLGEEVTMSEFGAFFGKYKGIAVAVTGICVITAIIALAVNITKLSTSAANESVRRQALIGILYSCLALGIFGSATIVIGVFWNMLSTQTPAIPY